MIAIAASGSLARVQSSGRGENGGEWAGTFNVKKRAFQFPAIDDAESDHQGGFEVQVLQDALVVPGHSGAQRSAVRCKPRT